MKEIKEEELKMIEGGAISVGTALAIIGGAIFLIGVFDGYLRPLKCH